MAETAAAEEARQWSHECGFGANTQNVSCDEIYLLPSVTDVIPGWVLARFSQIFSLASGLSVIWASSPPGRALYKGVILPKKKKKTKTLRCCNEGHAVAIGNLGGEHKSAQENGRELFEMCNSVDVSALAGCTATGHKLHRMLRRFPISHRNEIDATSLSLFHMALRSVFTPITWF